MLYDRRDYGLLRLVGTYQWLPLAPLRALTSLKRLCHEADLLSSLGLLTYSRSGEYLMLSPQGVSTPRQHGSPLPSIGEASLLQQPYAPSEIRGRYDSAHLPRGRN